MLNLENREIRNVGCDMLIESLLEVFFNYLYLHGIEVLLLLKNNFYDFCNYKLIYLWILT